EFRRAHVECFELLGQMLSGMYRLPCHGASPSDSPPLRHSPGRPRHSAIRSKSATSVTPSHPKCRIDGRFGLAMSKRPSAVAPQTRFSLITHNRRLGSGPAVPHSLADGGLRADATTARDGGHPLQPIQKTMPIARPPINAALDPSLHAALDGMHPLEYSEPPAPHFDLPAYVRAASAIRRLHRHLVIAQDDVNAFAILDPEDGYVFPIMLPRGPGERRTFDDIIGNKRHKMDLEALALLPDERLVAFGSGASASREALAVLSRREPPFVRDGAELYRSLRAQPAFAGSQLNIEGAVVTEEGLLLLQRGNGMASAGRTPTNAIARIDLGVF